MWSVTAQGHDEAMTDESPYWSNGFFTELRAHALSGDVAEHLTPMVERAAVEIAAPELADPPRALTETRARAAGFEARLTARWGRGLDLADLMIEESLQAGIWLNTEWRPKAAARQDQKFEALIRLHGRAIQTANEVQVLLRSGYSTGAMARWRTIHEIWVVSLLLAENKSEISRRYLVHEAIESMIGQEWYEDTWETLGFEPPDPADAAKRAATRAALEQEFGPAFLRNYGWAAPLFNGKAPKLTDLPKRANLDHWRSYYKMASHGVHANPKGIMWSLQDPRPTEAIWAGPSNSGLIDPAQCTLIALYGITACLLMNSSHELMDEGHTDQIIALVRAQILENMLNRAIEALDATHRVQEREEEDLRDLIAKASEQLGRQPGISTEDLANTLQVDVEDLAEALEAGVQRQVLDVHHRYTPRAPDPSMPTAATDAPPEDEEPPETAAPDS